MAVVPESHGLTGVLASRLPGPDRISAAVYAEGIGHPSGPLPAAASRSSSRPQRPAAWPVGAANPFTQPYGNGYRYPHGDPGHGNGGGGLYGAGGRRGSRGRHEATVPRAGDSLSAVGRIQSVTEEKTASITQQASYQVAMITRQVADEGSEIREAAKREADQIMQQASMQVAAVREAAEIQAAEVSTIGFRLAAPASRPK
jgi:hypothetical protein